jgi:hypothetical protein
MVQLDVVGPLCVIFALRLFADGERLQIGADHSSDSTTLGLDGDLPRHGFALAERFLKSRDGY